MQEIYNVIRKLYHDCVDAEATVCAVLDDMESRGALSWATDEYDNMVAVSEKMDQVGDLLSEIIDIMECGK